MRVNGHEARRGHVQRTVDGHEVTARRMKVDGNEVKDGQAWWTVDGHEGTARRKRGHAREELTRAD